MNRRKAEYPLGSPDDPVRWTWESQKPRPPSRARRIMRWRPHRPGRRTLIAMVAVFVLGFALAVSRSIAQRSSETDSVAVSAPTTPNALIQRLVAAQAPGILGTQAGRAQGCEVTEEAAGVYSALCAGNAYVVSLSPPAVAPGSAATKRRWEAALPKKADSIDLSAYVPTPLSRRDIENIAAEAAKEAAYAACNRNWHVGQPACYR